MLVYVLGIPAAKFNDDRLGRTLDAIQPHCLEIWQAVVQRALVQAEVDLNLIFYDLTAYILHGDYTDIQYGAFGFARNTPMNKRKFKNGLNVAADGNISTEYEPWSGKTAELTTVQQNMEQLHRFLARRGWPIEEVMVVGERAQVTVITSSVVIAKTPDTQTVESGGTATFTVTVTNTGDVTLAPITVTDVLAPDCDQVITSLGADSSTSYQYTQSQVTNGFVNTALVTGTTPLGSHVTGSDQATVIVGEETKIYLPIILRDYDPSIPPTQTPTPDPAGHALQFDGVDDYVDVPTRNGLSTMSSITFEAWVRLASLPPSDKRFGIAISGDATSCQDNFEVMLNETGAICTIVGTHNMPNCLEGPYKLTTLQVLQVGEWHHIAVIYEMGSGAFKVYVDGTLAGTATTDTSGLESRYHHLGFGRWNDGDMFPGELFYNLVPFHGDIDEIRIWNFARDTDDIQATMNTPLVGNEPGLVSYWTFNEGKGQTAYDATDSANNGQLGSSPSSDGSDPTWFLSDVPISGSGRKE